MKRKVIILLAMGGLAGGLLLFSPKAPDTRKDQTVQEGTFTVESTLPPPPSLSAPREEGQSAQPGTRNPKPETSNQVVIAEFEAKQKVLTSYGATLKRPDEIPVPINSKMSPQQQSNVWESFKMRQASAVRATADYMVKQNALYEELRSKLGEQEFQKYRALEAERSADNTARRSRN